MSSAATASVVLYRHSAADVSLLFEALSREKTITAWAVVNNGGAEEACIAAQRLGARVINPGRNVGYGAGHNLAQRSMAALEAPYHLILNPDISFPAGAVRQLSDVMDAMPQVGLLMPRVVYPDGATQYLCKLLPTPLDLFLRRFGSGPLRWLFGNRMNRYDMKDFNHAQAVYVPVLSGCFMFTRRTVMETIGGFDDRFFLYMEDTDLCRRIGEKARLLFWPGVTVTHAHAAGSYKNLGMLRLHLTSALAYFNKWGWFHDPARDARNRAGAIEAEIPDALPQPQAQGFVA